MRRLPKGLVYGLAVITAVWFVGYDHPSAADLQDLLVYVVQGHGEHELVSNYDSNHPITRGLSGVSTVFPLTRSVTATDTPPKGVELHTLAQTSEQSWGETNRAALQRGEAKLDPEDKKGPLAVAVA